jgi:hypothetical protein
MDFISLQTEQGAAFLFNIHNVTLIDPKSCQLYTVDNPAYGWTLSQKSMDDLMGAISTHIVAADQPEPAPVEPLKWDYPLPDPQALVTANRPEDMTYIVKNPAELVAHVVKEWNPNDTPLEKTTEPTNWTLASESLIASIRLLDARRESLAKALEMTREMEAEQVREGIRL